MATIIGYFTTFEEIFMSETAQKMFGYEYVVEKTDTGYCAYFTDIPGCVSTGSDIEELKANLTEALVLHLQGLLNEKMKEYNTKQLSSTITAKGKPSDRLKALQDLKNDLTYQLNYIDQQIKELKN